MTLILKSMKMLSLVQIGLRRQLIYSTALILSACAGLKPFPASTLVEYDNKNKVCGQYKITDPENLKFEYVKDIPCPSIFGFTSADIPKVLNWAQDSIEYGRQHCQ